MNISALIAELLHDYDCVIIPGLGGFIGNYNHAVIHRAKAVAYPPGKGIIFNKNLQNNDGLLANALAQQAQLSYVKANEIINEFVTNCKNELHKGNRINFDGLGFIFLDAEQNLQFKPDYTVNFLLDSFGLFPVAAKELVEEKPQEVKEVKLNPVIPQHNQTKENNIVVLKPNAAKKWKYIAAAAVILPFAFYSVWIPAKTDFLKTGKISFADLNPFKWEQNRKYFRGEHNIPKTSVITPSAVNPLQYSELIIDENEKFIVKPENNNTIYVAETTYVNHTVHVNTFEKNIHIIGGCFKEINNAYNLISSLKNQGYDAYILDEAAGLHRVAIAGFSTQAEALKALKEVRQKGHPAAWILNK